MYERVGSWLREAINTMAIRRRSEDPIVNMIRVAALLGSSPPETAAVLHCLTEEIQGILAGSYRLKVRQADKLALYVRLLWWWHCLRMGRAEAEDQEQVIRVVEEASIIWADIPAQLREDWVAIYAKLTAEGGANA